MVAIPPPADGDLPSVPEDIAAPTVASLSDDLARIARSIRAMRASWHDQRGVADRHAQCIELAKMIYHHRRLRGRLNPMFETYEPNWHMALAMLIARADGAPLALPALSVAARLSPAATRRRLLRLVDDGIVERCANPRRSRQRAYGLTADGETRVVSYLSSVIALLR